MGGVSAEMGEYFALKARLDTFAGTTMAGTGKRPTKKTIKWPHKHPSSEQMALAGFYFNPVAGLSDNATCFMCHKSLDGWEKDDIPAKEHITHAPECSWARIVAKPWQQMDSLEGTEFDPEGEESLSDRIQTFSNWPHLEKPGWRPTDLNMARAGFFYNPHFPDDDIAQCAYCEIELDGWEPGDDPVEEHRRRKPDCIVFIQGAVKTGTKRPSGQIISKNSKKVKIAEQFIDHDRDQELFASSELIQEEQENPSDDADDEEDIEKLGPEQVIKPVEKMQTRTASKRAKKGGKGENLHEQPENEAKIVEKPAKKNTIRARAKKGHLPLDPQMLPESPVIDSSEKQIGESPALVLSPDNMPDLNSGSTVNAGGKSSDSPHQDQNSAEEFGPPKPKGRKRKAPIVEESKSDKEAARRGPNNEEGKVNEVLSVDASSDNAPLDAELERTAPAKSRPTRGIMAQSTDSMEQKSHDSGIAGDLPHSMTDSKEDRNAVEGVIDNPALPRRGRNAGKASDAGRQRAVKQKSAQEKKAAPMLDDNELGQGRADGHGTAQCDDLEDIEVGETTEDSIIVRKPSRARNKLSGEQKVAKRVVTQSTGEETVLELHDKSNENDSREYRSAVESIADDSKLDECYGIDDSPANPEIVPKPSRRSTLKSIKALEPAPVDNTSPIDDQVVTVANDVRESDPAETDAEASQGTLRAAEATVAHLEEEALRTLEQIEQDLLVGTGARGSSVLPGLPGVFVQSAPAREPSQPLALSDESFVDASHSFSEVESIVKAQVLASSEHLAKEAPSKDSSIIIYNDNSAKGSDDRQSNPSTIDRKSSGNWLRLSGSTAASSLGTPPPTNHSSDFHAAMESDKENFATPSTNSKHPISERIGWQGADLDQVFSALADIEDISVLRYDQIPDQDNGLTVVEWIDMIAKRAEQAVQQKGEEVVRMVSQEYERAISALQKLPVQD